MAKTRKAPKFSRGDRVIQKRPGGSSGHIISCSKGRCFVQWSDRSVGHAQASSLRKFSSSLGCGCGG